MNAIHTNTEESNKNKAQLLSFLLYNLGAMLVKANKDQESKVYFKKGYEFSLATLGENAMLTIKYKIKFQTKIMRCILYSYN